MKQIVVIITHTKINATFSTHKHGLTFTPPSILQINFFWEMVHPVESCITVHIFWQTSISLAGGSQV